MARDEDPSEGKIKATVPLVIWRVPEEDTESRTGCQLVGSSGSGVRVTRTPEDLKVIIPRRGTEKNVVWRGSGASSGRKTIKEVGGGVQALSPEASRKRRLKQKGAHGVVGDANHAFSLAILRGGIRARHAQLDTVRGEESGRTVWTPKRRSEGMWEKHQTSHAREKSTNNEKNHRPPQDNTYSQKY
jgi:hypothetical protein